MKKFLQTIGIQVLFSNICRRDCFCRSNQFCLTVNSGEDMRRSEDTGYFHVCTDGRVLPWMFQDDMDFIAGVNRIAVCHLLTGISVLAFVLMDNHVHFVLYGTMPQCKEFINMYKRLVGRWIRIRYDISDHLRQLPVDIMRIDTEERLLNTLAYLDRNSVVAGFQYLPGEYLWGSARYVFKSNVDDRNYKPVSEFASRELRSLLKTRVALPGDWLIDENGMISPMSFLDIHRLESYFKSPTRYTYFLAKKLEGVVEQELEHSQKTFIPDKELRPIVERLAQQTFGVETVKDLDVNSRLALARKLRYDYASTLKQISRMVLLDKSLLEGFM